MITALMTIALCTTNMYCSHTPQILDKQPQFLHTIKSAGISTQIIHDVQQHGFLIPEHCYATSKNPNEYPLVILGASPCIAAFIRSSRGIKTKAMHISAYDDPEAIPSIIDATFNIDKNKRKGEGLYLTLFTLTNSKFEYVEVGDSPWFNEGYHQGRFASIIKVFVDNYTLINPQCHFCPEDRSGNDSPNCVCAGFDGAKQQLKVYSIDFKETKFISDKLSASKVVEFT